jgi:hypothetical protein
MAITRPIPLAARMRRMAPSDGHQFESPQLHQEVHAGEGRFRLRRHPRSLPPLAAFAPHGSKRPALMLANDPHRHRRRLQLSLQNPVTWRAPASRWRRNPPAGFLRPCERVLVNRPPAGSGWLHEIKHDGFPSSPASRASAHKSEAAAASEALYLDSAFPEWFTSEIRRCTGVYR